jgi:carbon monoxide dehydrogenase subunit G
MPTPPVIAYRGNFDFDVSAGALWESIENAEQFERWWPWLQEFRQEGEGLHAGTVMHGVVAPPLPYRMRVDVELLDCSRPTSIDAVVRRDLEGRASVRIRPRGSSGCTVEAAWSIEMMQRPMRIASLVAHPLLRWGHDRVVETTVRSFRRHLAAASGS